MNAFLSPDARLDLLEIWDYIARDSILAANRFIQRIEQAIDNLALMPGMGQLREDLADEPLRTWPVASYLIIYRHDRRPIEIARIVHGARDLPALFRH